MEYWDYTVEIECLKGAQGCRAFVPRRAVKPGAGECLARVSNVRSLFADVEAAAELGRTLLERNRELEATVREQQALIDDQALEMQVRTRSRASAGRRVNRRRPSASRRHLVAPQPCHSSGLT